MDPVYAVVFEILMLVCFGLSWPFNIAKSWKSRTAKGKSLIFEICIAVGYCCGIAGKILTNNVSYVLVVYALDLTMVCIDLILTLRNMALDHMGDKRAAKERELMEKEKEQMARDLAAREKELADKAEKEKEIVG